MVGQSTEQLIGSAILIAIFLLLAFPIHECAHAFAAYRLGDATAKMYGRLSLNPIVHFDPYGGMFLVISALAGTGLLFGWAKPTPVNPSNLRDRRNGEVIVALAGPGSNLVMAIVGALIFRALGSVAPDLPGIIWYVLRLFVSISIVLAIFNLIPIPPLDGSAILFRFLSPATAWQIRPVLYQYGGIILLVIIFTLVLVPPFGQGLGRLVSGLTDLLLYGPT